MVVSDEVLPVGDGVLGFEQWLGDGSFSVRSASLSGHVFSASGDWRSCLLIRGVLSLVRVLRQVGWLIFVSGSS